MALILYSHYPKEEGVDVDEDEDNDNTETDSNASDPEATSY
jgi:hypothetical protein